MYVVYGTKATDRQPSAFTRMAVLEVRAAKSVSARALAILPLMVFIFTLGMLLYLAGVHLEIVVAKAKCHGIQRGIEQSEVRDITWRSQEDVFI